MFATRYWNDCIPVRGGRGEVYQVESEGNSWLIKPYLRGGFIRRLVKNSYFFVSYRRTRMFREFQLLQYLVSRKVPVPRPVAAWARRSGCSYRGAIIVERLEGVQSLSEMLVNKHLLNSQWEAIGRCIASLHNQKVNHSDLNASNILVRGDSVFLIDFDRCDLRRVGFNFYRHANLRRFYRSLTKLMDKGAYFSARDLDLFKKAYNSSLISSR